MDFDMTDCTLDLMADVTEMDFLGDTDCSIPTVAEKEINENSYSLSKSDKNIEFFYNPNGMKCSVEGCSSITFNSKAKYQRHWTEKHTKNTIYYTCAIARCNVNCRRRYDMKVHLKNHHDQGDNRFLEDVLNKCTKVVKENKAFVDPGFFIFLGRTQKNSSINSASSSDVNVSPCDVTADTCISASSDPSTSLGTCNNVSSRDSSSPSTPPKRKVSLQEYQERDHPFRAPLPLEVSTQTRCQDYAPLQFPKIPDTLEDITAYLQWLDQIAANVGVMREAAKTKMENLKSSYLSPILAAEREKRRKLEAENLRLRKELFDIKSVDLLFPEL